MQGIFGVDPGQQKKKQNETRNKELAEFTDKIKKMFKDTDPNGKGTISRAALSKVFRELDASWTAEDLDEMLALVGGSGGSDIRYADFVDWFMEEQDPKLRKQLWHDLSNAFATSEAEEKDDDPQSDNAQDDLEAEADVDVLGIDLDELINYDLWQGLLSHLEIDEDEGKEIYGLVKEEMLEKGQEDESKGFPLREYLEELKIELDDLEGVKAVQKALDEAKADLKAHRNHRANAAAKGEDAATVCTLFDKVVHALDKNRRPAEDGWRLASEGKVQLSKAEEHVFQAWSGGEATFTEKVKAFMISPPVVNATSGQTVCKQKCAAAVEKIIKKFEESGTKFTDPDWNVVSSPNSVLYVDKEKPGYDCTVGTPAKWKRLTTIVKNQGGGTGSALGSLFGGFAASGAKKKPRPALFKGGVKAGDIIQGNIGTCFLLGAMGAIASNKEEAVQRMFIKYDVDAGVYGVRFNVDGEWTYVIVDDYMPVDYDGNILFARAKDPQEVWVPLLEKAFCKLHTCFEMCDGGQASEAINTMFGGVGGRFIVKKKHRRNPGSYFKVLKHARDKGWLLTTGFAPRGAVVAAAGKCGEAVLPTGLVGGHAYTIEKVVEACGNQLVCCRNPWGSGEWTGKWSDENAEGEWTEEMKAATGYRGLNDGRFWMSVEDFVANTTGAEYARTFGPNWKKISQYKHFKKGATLATAQYDFAGKGRNEIGFREGDKIEVTAFTGDWWSGNIKGQKKEGFFPGNYVKMDDRPVTCFELVGTVVKGVQEMTAVVMILQPKVHMDRKWFKRHEDGMNYKDLTYPSVQLVIVGPDGSVAAKKEGQRRSVWAELKLPGGGKWRVYALSTDGRGDMFTARVYLKDGTATFKEVPGATLDDLMGKI